MMALAVAREEELREGEGGGEMGEYVGGGSVDGVW